MLNPDMKRTETLESFNFLAWHSYDPGLWLVRWDDDRFKDLDDVTPSPGNNAVGEERAWGRRLARRFAIDAKYDAKTFISSNGAQHGFLDFESTKPEKLDVDVVVLFDQLPKRGGAMIVYGWTMAEQLVKLGKR